MVASGVQSDAFILAEDNSESPRTPSSLVTLQKQSRKTLHRHLQRATVRLTALLIADTTAYLLARAVIGAVRDAGLIGSTAALAARGIIPRGFLGGREYATALILGLVLSGSYGRGDKWRDPTRLLIGVALATALTLWNAVWVVGIGAVGVQFVATTAGVFGMLGFGRIALNAIITRTTAISPQRERAIFVGDPVDPLGSSVYSRLTESGEMSPLGWASTVENNGVGVLGRADEIREILQTTHADTVVLCGQLLHEDFRSVVSACIAGGCRVLAVPRHEGLTALRSGFVKQRGVRMVELTVPALRAQQLLIKRCVDVIGVIVGLTLLFPVFLVVAVAIRLDSPGPIFFSHERVGFGGKVFRMFKFRTMRKGADEEKASLAHLNHTTDPRLFKIPADPRVTRVGAWLRRWSVDELPQFINVLLGDMSLVGPRPFFEADLETYLDHHFARLGAKPGITGLWQVRGRSNVVDFEEVVRLDCEYIERWSLLLDAYIIAATLPAVVRKTGAY